MFQITDRLQIIGSKLRLVTLFTPLFLLIVRKGCKKFNRKMFMRQKKIKEQTNK